MPNRKKKGKHTRQQISAAKAKKREDWKARELIIKSWEDEAKEQANLKVLELRISIVTYQSGTTIPHWRYYDESGDIMLHWWPSNGAVRPMHPEANKSKTTEPAAALALALDVQAARLRDRELPSNPRHGFVE